MRTTSLNCQSVCIAQHDRWSSIDFDGQASLVKHRLSLCGLSMLEISSGRVKHPAGRLSRSEKLFSLRGVIGREALRCEWYLRRIIALSRATLPLDTKYSLHLVKFFSITHSVTHNLENNLYRYQLSFRSDLLILLLSNTYAIEHSIPILCWCKKINV
jgi:hypothetical protein